MGKKKGKGKKGKKGGKGKGSKKKDKKQQEEPPPPPELNVFVYFRRKNVTLCLETYAEETIKELKVQVATILRQFAEDITLFSTLGKEPEEMEEIQKPEVKKQEGSRGRSRDAKKEKTERRESPPKGPVHKTLSSYGYNPATANIFNPAVIGLAYRGDDGVEFEKLDITPYSQFPVIPEEIKMHLRNYVPPPPPPPPAKKRGGAGKSTTKVQQQQ